MRNIKMLLHNQASQTGLGLWKHSTFYRLSANRSIVSPRYVDTSHGSHNHTARDLVVEDMVVRESIAMDFDVVQRLVELLQPIWSRFNHRQVE